MTALTLAYMTRNVMHTDDSLLLIRLADALLEVDSKRSVTSAFIHALRAETGLRAVGLMIYAKGTCIQSALMTREDENTEDWQSRMEAEARDVIAESKDSLENNNTHWLPFFSRGDQSAWLYVSEPLPYSMDTLQRLGSWFYGALQREKESGEDALTGLLNNRRLDELFNWLENLCQRNKQPLSILMLDLDEFKKINDRFGHLAGDQLLRGFANHLKSSVRASDLVFRVGGDEFLVLLPGVDVKGATVVARRIGQPEIPLELGGSLSPLQLRISAGIATHREGQTRETWRRQADQAVYAAKESGEHTIATYDQDTGKIILL